MNIEIAIADDHLMMIQGLQHILIKYPHISLSGTYLNSKELFLGLETNVPDILLLDIQLPDQTGDEITPVLLRKYFGLRIIILTNFDSAIYINNLLKYGVHGYLLKTSGEATLIKAIETVYNGEKFIEPRLQEKMHYFNRDLKKATSKSYLTQREKDVLQLLVNGLTCPQIAEKLCLSINTIENYRAAIMLKLDVNNTAMLVNKALKTGLAT